MAQNFGKNTYHPTGQAAYLDLEQAKNNFEALASCFAGPQDPAALGFAEPGMLWLNNASGILSQRNESNSGWVTLFDLRNSRIATGRVTATSINNTARKPSLVTGQAISPASCSLHTALANSISQITNGYSVGDVVLVESGSTVSPTSLNSPQRIGGIRLGRWGGSLRVRMAITARSFYTGDIECVLRRNGSAIGSVLWVYESQATGALTQTVNNNQPGDHLEMYVSRNISTSQDVTGNIQISASIADAPLAT